MRKNTSTLLWHYTTVDRLQSILCDGVIKTTRCASDRTERPAVWFSRNQSWEMTACKGIVDDCGNQRLLTYVEMVEYGIARIGVRTQTAAISWGEFCATSGVSQGMTRALMKAGRRLGASHKDWFVSFAPIGREHWVSIQTFTHWAWSDLALSLSQYGEQHDLKLPREGTAASLELAVAS